MVTTESPDTAERFVAYMPLLEVRDAPVNPKRHAGDRIAASIARFGLGELPLLDDRTGRLVAGHGRINQLRAAHARGDSPPDGVRLGEDGDWLVPVLRGWASRSDDDARSYLVASNRTGELGGWDDSELADLLADMDNVDAELVDAAGFNREEFSELLDRVAALDTELDDEDDEDEEDGRSELLGLAGVTVPEPTHQPKTGQVWELGRHVLVVDDVFTGHAVWGPLLAAESIFLPYPTMLAPFSKRAAEAPLVLVQPDTYIAGNMLDKWLRVTGEAPRLVDDES